MAWLRVAHAARLGSYAEGQPGVAVPRVESQCRVIPD